MYQYNSLLIPVKKGWVLELLKEYQTFLEEYHKDQKTVYHHLKWSADTFVAMESLYPHELTYKWLNDRAEMRASKKSLRGFLLEKRIIQEPDPSVAAEKECERLLQKCPEGFKKCISWYYKERFQLRQKQVEKEASSPISVKTIIVDTMSFVRMVSWITDHHNDVKRWSDITEEITNEYLLTLTPHNRECMRKDLYQFYKFALRKKHIFSIPMVDYKARELPRKTTTLTLDQQASLFTKIRKTGSNEPYAAILTILAAYHALRSSNIITIKLKDVDIDKRRIYMEDIPDLFLTDIETRIMQEYLKIRKTFHLAEKRSYLFIRQGRGCYEDRSINTRYVNDLVTDYSGYTPKVLRISCLVEMSKLFGPQFLREAYGVSNTHAGRFGKYEDYLLDKTVNDLLTVETR